MKSYPGRGTVTATRLQEYSKVLPRNVAGRQSIRKHIPVARIETPTMLYEFEGPALQVGATLEFRIDRDHAYVHLEKDKEAKYLIVSAEQK